MTELTTTPRRQAPAYRDGNRYLWLIGLIPPMLVPLAWGMHAWTGSPIAWWTGPIAVYGVFALLDLVVGRDSNNPPEAAVPALEEDRWYRWITYAYVPVQFASFFIGFWLLTRDGMSLVDKFGVMVTLGMTTGIAITVAHELGHKRPDVERWLAKICLAPSCYGHFYVEHNRGHHVRVATPEDPASSRFGENLWTFMPRTVIGGFRSAYRLEAKRFRRSGKSPISLKNDVLNAQLLSVLLAVVVAVAFGPAALGWFVFQAAIGSLIMFEAVNYLEHYGLLRQRIGTRYEKVLPEHSWNNNNRISNLILFQLQRHSDHHANPTRRYQALRHFEEAPLLPTGYAGMLVLAYFPPLWRAVMDHRVVNHFDGDMTRANILPRKRSKVLARYSRAA